ncbi:MAG: TonB-dependent receptor, partial [Rufibacter sp.]
MNTVRFLLLSLGWMLLSFMTAQGQTAQDSTISGDFTNAPFQEFVQRIEGQTKYRFYFNPIQVDSLRITVHARQEPLERVLNRAFANSDFQFAIDSDQRVFVVKGTLQASLPPGFFTRSAEEEVEPALANVPASRSNRRQTGSPNRLYEIGIRTNSLKPGSATISGTVTDAKTGQPVIGAVVMIETPLTAASTDQNGFYALTLPRGRHVLKIKSVGQKEVRRQVMLYSDGKLNVQLQEDVVSLNEVLVRGDRDKNVSGLNMGVEKLSISTIKQVPTVFGEADVMKVVLTLPGVKSVGESSTGLNVRGGATDQNLILFGGATIYNPSHLFGFFSAFNPDVMKGVELYKNSIPAKFGGRLASVLDVTSREGNKQKFGGSGGLGLISSRLMIEGPIIKNKKSFLIAGRTTYSDWLLKQLPSETLSQSKASFYDLNASISHQVDSSNSLSLEGYLSNDRFRFGSDTAYHYSNKSAILKWKHTFHDNFYGELSAAYTDYQYSVTSEKNPINAFGLAYHQQQNTLKVDFNNTSLPKHAIDFGASTNHYKISPGNYTPRGTESLVKPDKVAAEQALESALYLSDEYELSPRFAVSLGLRYSFFHYLGPKDVITYAPGASRSENTMGDTLAYGNRKLIKMYHGPEYRASAR